MNWHQRNHQDHDRIVAATQTIAAVLALLTSTLLVGCGTSASQEDPNKWGFIDRQGHFVIKPQFSQAGSFAEGLAPAQLGDTLSSKYGYIDKHGTFLITPQFLLADSFSEGLASVEIGEIVGKWGYIDKQGHFAINPQYGYAGPFKSGLAQVELDNSKTEKWVFIDMHEHVFMHEPEHFADGLTVFSVKEVDTTKYGYRNKEGHVVIKPQFSAADSFTDGLASVRIGGKGFFYSASFNGSGKWGYIDTHGHFAINPQFSRAKSFAEGLAAVRVGGDEDGNWGFIDKQGSFVIKPQFAHAGSFGEGLAPVRLSDNDKHE